MSDDQEPVTIFKVKWQGYNKASDHTWEPAESFNGPSVILEYMRTAGLTANDPTPSKAPSASRGAEQPRVMYTPARPGRIRSQAGSGSMNENLKPLNVPCEDDAAVRGLVRKASLEPQLATLVELELPADDMAWTNTIRSLTAETGAQKFIQERIMISYA
ncbi:putative chromo/chromo shadow domain, Chromo-like domain superfamily protein [Septoria linicola]|nr:putative chromo/chromo shadow domain, Chromo-like domain superfamily protein [Septoria linicola]